MRVITWLRTHVWDSLWLLALVAYSLAGTPVTPFHADEATQIFMSRDYAYWFLARDLDRLRYVDPPAGTTEQHLRLLNGTVNKYLIGLAWHVSGFTQGDLNEQWDWGADWNYNQSNNHAPLPELLSAARWPSALLMAAGIPVMFGLGLLLDGRLAAYLASACFALNPALLLNGHRAMMEGSLIFFSLLTVLAAICFIRRAGWLDAALLGAASGLALASKHSAVFTTVPVLAACFALIIFRSAAKINDPRQRQESMIALLQLAAAALLALTIFYALNPAWWGDPLTRAGQVLRLRQDLLDTQNEVFGGYASPLEAGAGFARQALLALPQYYEVPGWDVYIGDQIARYESSPWRGASIGGSFPGMIVLIAAMMAGFRRLRGAKPGKEIAMIWIAAAIASTLFLTPLEWQRYYLPVFPALGLLAALGTASVWRWLRRRTVAG